MAKSIQMKEVGGKEKWGIMKPFCGVQFKRATLVLSSVGTESEAPFE